MSITKEVLEVEETLKNKVNNILSFLGIKASIEKGNIISIDNTNNAKTKRARLFLKYRQNYGHILKK